MGAVQMSLDSLEVHSIEELSGRFLREFHENVEVWKQRLCDSPDELASLEQEVHQLFSRGADYIIAGLLALVMRQKQFLEEAEALRQGYSTPLRSGVNRTRKISLMGGLVIWITSLYCAARRGSRDGAEPTAGVYTELAQLGMDQGVTPGLESRVARQAALAPSLAMAQQELSRQGVQMDIKTVRRVSQHVGQRLLALRRDEVLQWREGKLAVGTELAGKRVCVQIDGGRTRIRSRLSAADAKTPQTNEDGLIVDNQPGRSKKKSKRTFSAEWREPKLVRIFVHDDEGKMDKEHPFTIDGTFEGPDALAELVAMHLVRLGAGQALHVTFVADGATWIWDRIDRIIELAGLQHVPTEQVLDNCHASHHIQLALKALGLSDTERMPLYLEHRTLLRNGQWRRVVDELMEVASSREPNGLANEAFQREIQYLTRHGEAGRMKYVTFRRKGLPIGSGAIESSIRCVVNMRLKGSGTFWLEEGAEAMLQLRSQVISNRWDQRLRDSRKRLRTKNDLTYRWDYRPMSRKTECANENSKYQVKPTP